MATKIVWTVEALGDVKSVCDFIALDNPTAASRIGLALFDRVKILSLFPLAGRAYATQSGQLLRELVFRSYRIFYEFRVEENAILILHVWHSARDEPEF